ncbi:MAG: DUF3299 domain-containing protein [Granulosicoccus sp.]|nr:DUF3299 domain-containing protein [Granulosicoccus sp.]
MQKHTIRQRATLLISTVLLLGIVASAQAWWWKSDDASNSVDATELQWEDMVPEGFVPMQSPLGNMSQEQIDKLFDGSEESNRELAEIEEMMAFAPTVPELDGQRVKLPGYVVPLDFDGQTQMTEFLLVPYYGACIHTPPPPANQVVHATTDTSVTVENTYEPVWAIGTMRTQTVRSNLAEAGYTLDIDELIPYQQTQSEQ